jgi:hypothetical protein
MRRKTMQTNARTVDPMSLILSASAYRIWVEQRHPHEPKVADIQVALQTLTLEEQSAALSRAKAMVQVGRAVEEAMGTIRARG